MRRTVAQVLLYWSLSCHDSASPPKMAGATLSGWPSISLVSCRIQSRPRRDASGTKALAATTAATTADAEEPSAPPVRVDVVGRDPQAFVPESEAVQRLARALTTRCDCVAGQLTGTLAGELELKFTAWSRVSTVSVSCSVSARPEAVVAGAEVGAGGRHPDGDALARRNGRRGQLRPGRSGLFPTLFFFQSQCGGDGDDVVGDLDRLHVAAVLGAQGPLRVLEPVAGDRA